MPARYRKKPVVIDALKFVYTKEGMDSLRAFCSSEGPSHECMVGEFKKDRHINAVGQAEIITLEDGTGDLTVKHIASEGDYIIKGVQGEFYPCKPDIFLQTYEEV